MSGLRQRPVPKETASSPATTKQSTPTSRNADDQDQGISVLDIIRLLVTLAVLSCGLSYYTTSSESLLWGYRPWFTKWPQVVRSFQGPINLTPEQLALYDGTDPSRPIYLAINGSIFDVSANRGIYGPGGGYSFFTGRDATRAFVTGCFQEDLTNDMRGVEEMFIPVDDPEEDEGLTNGEKKIRREQDLRHAKARVEKQVRHWENFFRNHKKYFQVGKVVGGRLAEGTPKRELCEAAKKQRPKRETQ